MVNETAFELAASNIRFGAGVTREVGMDLVDLGARRVLLVTDPTLSRMAPVRIARESIESAGLVCVVYDRARVEPSDESLLDAIAFANADPCDAIVAVGGGSAIDTAKAVNLYTTYPPEDFLDYVNPPVGKGLPVPGPLKTLIAIPTTAGTGSETTGVSIFDYKRLHAKTGIANRRLKPTLGLLDPDNTKTMPPQVAASTGLDILSHAVESFTAMSFAERCAWLSASHPPYDNPTRCTPVSRSAPSTSVSHAAKSSPLRTGADWVLRPGSVIVSMA
jgi:hydroxyacid-oxoacid transhydrogenase